MPVNLPEPDVQQLLAIDGVRLGIAQAGIRKADRDDICLMLLDEGAQVAGVFTQNRFCAAPVLLCREYLENGGGNIRALLINTGVANAGTGETGLADARRCCEALAEPLHITPAQVLPFSTGVIMEPLPVERLTAALPAAIASAISPSGAAPAQWLRAAQAIMTTDTVPKAASRSVDVGGARIAISGICKGAGMIHPNMATMLGFIATDARIAPALMQPLVRALADASFNCISVDGDTSTNDSFMLIATARSAAPAIESLESDAGRALVAALTDVAQHLAQAIVRNGEGASKFITVRVEGGRDAAECRQVAYAIAHSPLVKTAFFASDPNLGRILAAIGYAGIADLDTGVLDLYLDDVHVATRGGRHPAYREEDGQRVMKQDEITVRVQLARGSATATVWTCDLSHDYVSINADYRS